MSSSFTNTEFTRFTTRDAVNGFRGSACGLMSDNQVRFWSRNSSGGIKESICAATSTRGRSGTYLLTIMSIVLGDFELNTHECFYFVERKPMDCSTSQDDDNRYLVV